MLFYINIPFKLIVSDALRIAIKHECIFRAVTVDVSMLTYLCVFLVVGRSQMAVLTH